MNSKSVVVIGAGIGGLTAAIHLAHHGFHVTIVEKNSHPGGRCDRFSREGHRFDTGPTLFVMPLLYDAEFMAWGASMHELLGLQRVDPTYHLVFDDGCQLALGSDLKSMQEQLEMFERGSFQNLLRYLEEGRRHYELTLDRLVNRNFCRASDFFRLQNLDLLIRLQPLIHHYRHMSSYFHSPRLKAAFTFQDIYMGLSPFEAPATYSLMPYSGWPTVCGTQKEACIPLLKLAELDIFVNVVGGLQMDEPAADLAVAVAHRLFVEGYFRESRCRADR